MQQGKEKNKGEEVTRDEQVASRRADAPAVLPGDDERRRYHQAREIFEYAFSMLEPMLHPDAGWQGRSLHHVSFNLVAQNFPHLGHDEVHALLDAVKRVFVERNEGAATLMTPESAAG